MGPLVSTDWLAERLDDPTVKVVDGSWYLPQMQRDALAEFAEAHIPGAVHFDIDAIADTSRDLPHMLPDARTFSDAVGALGISQTDTIVVYDGMGLFSAARVWWTFRVMGASSTYVLAGGLPRWTGEGRPTQSGSAHPTPATFASQPMPGAALTADEVLALTQPGAATQIVDVRPAERFRGAVPEPREGLRAGHIPGSRNLPFPSLIDNGSLADPETLQARLTEAGVDPARPVVTSCGSGVTAAMLNLALAQLGVEAFQLYDGSWTEWGADQRLPIETG